MHPCPDPSVCHVQNHRRRENCIASKTRAPRSAKAPASSGAQYPQSTQSVKQRRAAKKHELDKRTREVLFLEMESYEDSPISIAADSIGLAHPLDADFIKSGQEAIVIGKGDKVARLSFEETPVDEVSSIPQHRADALARLESEGAPINAPRSHESVETEVDEEQVVRDLETFDVLKASGISVKDAVPLVGSTLAALNATNTSSLSKSEAAALRSREPIEWYDEGGEFHSRVVEDLEAMCDERGLDRSVLHEEVFAHQDAHTDNLMRRDDDSLVLIDYSRVCIAPRMNELEMLLVMESETEFQYGESQVELPRDSAAISVYLDELQAQRSS